MYGGLRREDDPDFSTQDAASEVIVKAGATETIEIPAPEVMPYLLSHYLYFLLFFFHFYLGIHDSFKYFLRTVTASFQRNPSFRHIGYTISWNIYLHVERKSSHEICKLKMV